MTFLGEQPQADFVGPFSFCYGQTCQKMGAVKSHEMGTERAVRGARVINFEKAQKFSLKISFSKYFQSCFHSCFRTKNFVDLEQIFEKGQLYQSKIFLGIFR